MLVGMVVVQVNGNLDLTPLGIQGYGVGLGDR